MDPSIYRDARVLWAFWIACGLAVTGAIAPLLLAGGGPISGVAIPFGIAAIAMATNALSYPRGRSLATALYVLAWIAVVYGILRMIAVPLEITVLGTCPALDSGCSPAFARPFSGGEGAGIGVGLLAGALALQVGFFGLRILYRGPRKLPEAAAVTVMDPAPQVTAPPQTAPAPPAPAEAPALIQAPTPETPAAGPAAAPPPARKPSTRRSPKQAAELSAPVEPAELPPHPEPAELPAHSQSAELPPAPEPGSSTASSS
jgi:hypothetical protein